MQRESTLSAIIGSLAVATALGAACSAPYNRDDDTLGAPLGQSTAQGPSDPTRPPSPPSPPPPLPALERVPTLSPPPPRPPTVAPLPTATETDEPPIRGDAGR